MKAKMVIVIGLSLFLFSGIVAGQQIRLTNGEWPPYLSKDLPEYGFASKVIKEAFARHGIQVIYGFFPWKRAFVLAQRGEWDGSVCWSYKKEREKDFYYSAQPVLELKDVFFYRKALNFSWDTIEDLKQYRMGITSGYAYGSLLDKAIQGGQLKIDIANKDLLNFRKLIKGRIDIFPCTLDVGLTLLKKNFTPQEADKVTYDVAHPIRTSGYFLLLSKKVPENAQRIKLFDQGLSELKKNGQYAKWRTEMINQ